MLVLRRTVNGLVYKLSINLHIIKILEYLVGRLGVSMAIVTFKGLALHRKKTSEKLFECTRKNDE